MEYVYLYGHAGAANHGNEAIVRGLANVLKNTRVKVFSLDREKDIEYGLLDIVDVEDMKKDLPRYSIKNIIGFALYQLRKHDAYRNKYEFAPVFNKCKNKVFLLEMGDQYCENYEIRKMYSVINKNICSRGGRTIALGCSINAEVLGDKSVINDLKLYSAVIARESLTCELLQNKGINSIVIPDCAFMMPASFVDLSEIMNISHKYIGIVIGGIAQGNESKLSTLISGAINLIENIIKNTDDHILLIPHVNIGKYLSDITIENEIYEKFVESERVHLLPEMRADYAKYVISKCEVLCTLRTHASIAGYSSCVPTLVMGYSIKSKGIAKDIFGEYEKYVVDVNSKNFEEELRKKFFWIYEHRVMIRDFLIKKMPFYISRINELSVLIHEV